MEKKSKGTYTEKVKVEHNTKGYGDNDVTYTHASYGMIRASRVSGSFSGNLFGTEVDNSGCVEITVGNANLTQDLGDNWYYMYNTILKVALTPVQYAEFITNPNTEGVPCTIKYTKELGHIKYEPHATEVDYNLEKVKTSADKILDLTEARRKKAIEILSQKGGLKKVDKDTLIGLFNGITKEISGEIPFYTDMVKKSAERMVMESRADAEAFVTNIHAKLGSTILNNPEAIKLLLEDKSDES